MGNSQFYVGYSSAELNGKRTKMEKNEIRIRIENSREARNNDTLAIPLLSSSDNKISEFIEESSNFDVNTFDCSVHLELHEKEKRSGGFGLSLFSDQGADDSDGSRDNLTYPKSLLNNVISIIPDSATSDKIIENFGLKKSSVGGMEFFTSEDYRINLIVIKLGNIDHVVSLLGYFRAHARILLILPKISRYGTTTDIFTKLKKAHGKQHQISELSYETLLA
jgi:hypothetical protein